MLSRFWTLLLSPGKPITEITFSSSSFLYSSSRCATLLFSQGHGPLLTSTICTSCQRPRPSHILIVRENYFTCMASVKGSCLQKEYFGWSCSRTVETCVCGKGGAVHERSRLANGRELFTNGRGGSCSRTNCMLGAAVHDGGER